VWRAAVFPIKLPSQLDWLPDESISMQNRGRRAVRACAQQPESSSALEAGLFRAHFDRLPGPAYIWERDDVDFRLIAHNHAAGELPRSRVTEFLGRAAEDLFTDQPQIVADLHECARTGGTISRELDFVYATGITRKVAMTLVALTSDIVVVHTLDITERFEANLALRNSEQRYRTIVDNAHEGIWVTDSESVTTFVNQRAAEILGYSPGEMLGRHIFEFMPEDSLAEAEARRQRRLAGIKEQFDSKLLHRDGSTIWVSVAGAPMFDPDGKFIGAVSMLSDVTQRRNDEAALRASEARFRLLLATLPDLVAQVDRNGRHIDIYVSDNIRSSPPYSIDDMLGRTCSELFGEEFGKEHQQYVCAALESGTTQLWEYEFDYKGSVRHMEAHFMRVADDAVAVTCRDNTDRVNLEREVIAIGERERNRIGRDLHDGLAQLLTGVKLLLRTLANKLDEQGSEYGDDARRAMELVQNAIGHTSELARGLSPIPKGAKLSDGLIQLAEQSTRFFAVKCRYGGSTRLSPLSEEASAHLYRIAQEAVTNAVRHGRAQSIELGCSASKGRITLSISDDGVGFPDQESIKGGMGLSIMRYRASSLGGTLAVERGPDGGTTVRCSCPLSTHRL
jgi:PAS domain S-box-containing protein